MSSSSELHSLCRAIVEQTSEEYSWTLLSIAEWTDCLYSYALESGKTDSETLRKLATYIYCRDGFYPACIKRDGSAECDQGYRELRASVWEIAKREGLLNELSSAEAQDVLQEAIKRVYEKLDALRNSGTILGFAIQKFRDARRQHLKQQTRNQKIQSLLPHESPTSNPGTQIPCDDLRERVQTRLKQFKQENSQSGKRIEALWLYYIEDMPIKSVCELLDIPESSIHSILSRGRGMLRKDPELYHLAQELLESDC